MGSKERNIERVSKNSGGVLHDNVERLRELFPECVTEGKIDFEKLRETLGDEIDDRPERYSFSWAGKRDAIRILQTPSRAALKPCAEESLDWDTTKNIFIEGENLEALKLLYKSYFGRVKMIYIDPPYNTGNDFIYPDNYADPLDTYLKLTGQKDTEGNLLTSNPETSGRYHSAWLSMMYPRLFIARQLLRDDGVIFVSIDDHEVHNLRMLMNEIFGEENFVAQIVWKKKYTGGKHTKGYVDMHEYIVVYGRSITCMPPLEVERPEDEKDKFNEQDEFFEERGRFYVRPLKSNLESRPTLVYPIELPDGSTVCTQWLVAKPTFEKLLQEKRVEFRKKRDGAFQVYKKYYEKDGDGLVKPLSLIEDYPNTQAKSELKELFGIEEGRDNLLYTVKPTALIKHLSEPFLGAHDIMLDFFCGAASAADAVMQLNREDGGNRRFIMVQLPEPTGRGDYPTIADIGKERIRRVIAKLKKENEGKLELQNGEPPEDLGFRVFKLDESTFRQWKGDGLTDADEYVKQMELFTDPLLPGWEKTPEDVIYEVAVKEGYSLSARIEKSSVAGKTIYTVTDAEKNQSFRICLEKKLTMNFIRALNLQKTDLFICRDVALDDELAANLALQCRVKTI